MGGSIALPRLGFGNQAAGGQANSAVSQYVGGGGTDPYQDFNFSGIGNQSGQGGQNPWDMGGMGLEQLGQMGNIAGGLFGMYNQYQAMKAGKTQMNNQTKTGNYNMANNTNFNNATIDAFGSGQSKAQNQFGSMV